MGETVEKSSLDSQKSQGICLYSKMPRPALGPIQWASGHFRYRQVAARSWPIHFYLPPPRLQEQMCLTAHTYYRVTCHCRLRDSSWTVVAHRLDPRIEDMQLTVVCGHDTTCIPRRRKWCENSEPSVQTGHYSRSATVPTVLGRASGCGCVLRNVTWCEDAACSSFVTPCACMIALDSTLLCDTF